MTQIHQDAQRTQPTVIYAYTLSQAIADGVVHSVGWTGNGKPLVGTAGTVKDLPAEEIRDLFTRFFTWQRDIEPTLPEDERMFAAEASNGQTIWVIEDGQAVTVLYPSEY